MRLQSNSCFGRVATRSLSIYFLTEGISTLTKPSGPTESFDVDLPPKYAAYHLRDPASLSLNRERNMAWTTRAAQYFAYRHFNRRIRGVSWKSKFWRNPATSSIPELDLLCDPQFTPEEITVAQIKGASCRETSIAKTIHDLVEIQHQEALANGYALARCTMAGDAEIRDFLVRKTAGRVIVLADGRASFGGIRHVEQVTDSIPENPNDPD